MDFPIRRALIAVYDKTGIADFARALVDEFGIEIISTGGTAKHLQQAGIPVTLVEQVTGFPELLDGRVKTLHPMIHAAILADRDNPEHMRQLAEHGIRPIDMVVVNLYPFEQTIARPECTPAEAIEMIDIGGPCLLRAAAKNHRHVLVNCDTWSLDDLLDSLRIADDAKLRQLRVEGADSAFWMTSTYDSEVQSWLSRMGSQSTVGDKVLRLFNPDQLRYGENPHQQAYYYHVYDGPRNNAVSVQVGTGPELSFNNLVDASAAQDLCVELTHVFGGSPDYASAMNSKGQAVCAFIKHTNACGVGIASDPIEAYRKAYLGDPNAAMGGILAVNFSVEAPFAQAVMESLSRWGKHHGASAFFLECWLSPGFIDDSIVNMIRSLKQWGSKVRLLDTGNDVDELSGGFEFKPIVGGMLMQSRDTVGLNEAQWKVVTRRAPDEREMADLRLAWLIAKHTKSNAISLCRDGMLIGNGAGQMSRVMSCRIATWLAKENGHAEKLAGAVAASDAFFPFRDGPDLLIDAGVTAIIQPGGSKRDDETIAACDARGVAMIFTGTRHFRH